MKLYPIKKCKKGCEADVVAETAVLQQRGRRGRPTVIRAKQIHHYRERDGARFWHWSDQKVVRI